MAAARDVFRIDDGEEARLTPGGPHAAVIVSRGYLPLRYREERTPTRAAFPGTCVRFGDGQYEVVAEMAEGDTVTYGLRPWPAGEVVRQVVDYAPQLVRGARAERRRMARREKAAPHRWLLAPLLGLLPEERQARACDAVGLHAGAATFASGALEALAILFWARSFAGARLGAIFEGALRGEGDLASGAVQGYLWGGLFTPLVSAALVAAVWRALWAAVYGEAAGSLLLHPFFAVFDRLRSRLADPTLVPLTRDAFWTRLALPDRVVKERGGTVLVRSLLAHVAWADTRRLRFGDDWWDVEPLPAARERGRLVHQYRLTPPPDARTAAAPHDYADDVHAAASRGWDDLFAAGLGPLLTLLPGPVQQRAFARRGGPRAALAATMTTALVQLGLGVWLARSGLGWSPLVAAWCAGEGLFRLLRAATGGFGPSLLGHAFADLLPPERGPYVAHRDAEARALRGA